MKASDEAIRLLDKRQLDAGMLRLHLRHEFFNVPHQLELCHGWKGATDAARIEVAARLPVDNVVRQFPIHAQARLESLKRRLTHQLRRDALLEGLSTIVVDNHAPERRGSK